MLRWPEGTRVRVAGPFTDEASGNPVDPDVVVFGWAVGGVTGHYKYGVDSQLVRDSVGKYHVDLSTHSLPGLWSTVWASQGLGEAAGPLEFLIDPTTPEPVFI